MKVLTLHQPWASLVATGAKTVETRSWSTKHRGPLAIHAAKTLPKSWHEFRHRSFIDALGPLVGVNRHGVPNIDRLPTGCALAVVNLVDVFEVEDLLRMTVADVASGTSEPFVSPDELAFGDYSPGRYGWVFNNIRKLTQPFPYKGAQRIWTMRDADAFVMTNLMPSSPLTREEAEQAWK